MAEPLLTPRKAELVRLAGGLFAARGFHGTSMRDIGDTRGGGDLGLLDPSGVDESNFDVNSLFSC